MAMRYLGETFDLHTGGIDNLFPHHENEIAQAEGATGKPFVTYWMHCAHLRVNGEKMSKSLGNFFTLRDLVDKGWSGREIRTVLINGHYRQALNFTFDALDAARAALARVDECVDALGERAAGAAPAEGVPVWAAEARDAFAAAVHDDLNMPEAFAALFALVRGSNSALHAGALAASDAAALLALVDRMDSVLGVIRFGRADRAAAVPAEITALAEARAAARAAKDWAGADRLRDELAAKGWEVRDSKEGQKLKKL
jgi:cysteinyl-tRNA synthetase